MAKVALPKGLSINPLDGRIEWTPPLDLLLKADGSISDNVDLNLEVKVTLLDAPTSLIPVSVPVKLSIKNPANYNDIAYIPQIDISKSAPTQARCRFTGRESKVVIGSSPCWDAS